MSRMAVRDQDIFLLLYLMMYNCFMLYYIVTGQWNSIERMCR